MNQRQLVLWISVGALILLGAGMWYWYANLADQSATGERGGFFSSLFPFSALIPDGTGSTEEEGGAVEERPVPDLRLVTNEPVSGAGFVADEDGTLRVRYMERRSGHIFETTTGSFSTIRISNTTLPGVEEMRVLPGTAIVFRKLDDAESMQNFYATLATGTPEQSLSGRSLGSFDRIETIGSEQALVVTKTTSGSVIDLLSLVDGRRLSVLSSPISSWVPRVSDTGLYIETAPANSISGYLYSLAGNGTLTKVAGDAPGLVTLPSPSGRYILESTSLGAINSLSVFDTETRLSSQSNLWTLPEKCAWIGDSAAEQVVFCGVPFEKPDAIYPDDWLSGAVSFEDNAWLLAPSRGIVESFGILTVLAGRPIDIYRPVVSPDGNYALFLNKADLSLWLLKLD